MAQNIANNAVSYENALYYDPKFHTMLRDHLINIRQSVCTQPMVFDANVAHHAKGDLYMAFRQSGLSPKYWWITMIINNITSPEQYDGERTNFVLPDIDYIDDLYRMFNTVDGNI